MRNLIAGVALVSLIALAGCGEYRESMMTVPDRSGHSALNQDNPAPKGANKNKPIPLNLHLNRAMPGFSMDTKGLVNNSEKKVIDSVVAP